ncbi:sensor histidine kinase [Amycolatopsis rhabdoformis]|uniref:histidine kinase n=1 Tax=Amycolatopsis rhabdoformis TaxID=1448059 RepID=A0ABZ1ILA8_9PSEU|nr:sensor histidine kinase [Amycolatopsis rhabdoformis]WSE35325.1 sensor histidine kinase [Amycolatopsis rhabdoformis]
MAGDTLLAALLLFLDLVLYVGGSVGTESHPPAWFIALPIDVAMVAPLVFRRKKPLASAYVVYFVAIAHASLSLGFSSVAALAMSLYSILVYIGRKQGLIYVGALVLMTAVEIVLDRSTPWLGNALFTAFGIALCWTLGEFVGARRAYQLEVEARLHLLETERDQATRIAVAEERGRIARELHDVVAHSVSVMVVQADGAALALPTNPELAGRALQTISETGRGALGELRRLLEVLRGDHGDGEPRVPQPDAGALGELAERMRGAGMTVDLRVDDGLTDLPAGVSLGVYRIVQESLTNTLKHAGTGARAEVHVRRWSEGKNDTVEVLVRDDGAGRARQLEQVTVGAGAPSKKAPRLQVAGGNGLIGMRERANVYGGTLEVGPAPAGGWQVRAVLPVRLAP